jgi:hypothetical protein
MFFIHIQQHSSRIQKHIDGALWVVVFFVLYKHPSSCGCGVQIDWRRRTRGGGDGEETQWKRLFV